MTTEPVAQRGHIAAVDLAKCTRLLNHGPTVLVSARHGGVANAMSAAWACALDFMPPKVSVVLDKATATRRLIEQSGWFTLQVPTVAQLGLTQAIGTLSLATDPDKAAHAGLCWLAPDALPADACAVPGELPLVAGCAAWLACELIPEPHNQQCYDLFIGEVKAAWADARVFRDGRWRFDEANPDWRSLHHVAGGHYYAIGEGMDA